MTFAVAINGRGTQISISQLSFFATSTDPGNALAFAFLTGTYNYGTGYMGVLKGADGNLGTGDDIFVTSGDNTQLVDAIYGRGSGNSFAAYCPGCSISQQQAAIDAATPGSPYQFTGTYHLGDATGSATFNVGASPVPGPIVGAGLPGLVMAFGGFVAWRRRQRALAA
jgi:hypothetical protein